jgi:glucose-1-phosphate adenylyltransferase
MQPVSALILAGGRGKRMDIFCEQRPKPILPFAGKHRVIDATLNNCFQSKIENVAVLVDYQRLLMTRYLQEWNSAHMGAPAVAVLPPRLGSYAGTANAVFQNLDYLENESSDTILILSGDHIYNMDYSGLLDFHHKKQADVTVAYTTVPQREAYRFGTLCLSSDSRITEFIEKSSTPLSNLASMGIYVFNRNFLVEKLIEDANNPNSPHDFGYTILPKLVKRACVFGFSYSQYWQDIGTVESYYQANMQLLRPVPHFNTEKNTTALELNPGMAVSTLNVPGYVVNSLVSPGCIIEGYVENSILSPGVWIGEKARVVNSIVMANTCVKYHSVVDRCILDEDVNIDRFCYVGFGSDYPTKVNEITLVGKEVFLGPNTAVGKNSKIMPGLRLSDFKNRFVAPGTVVSAPV